jgi:hypothetical protein
MGRMSVDEYDRWCGLNLKDVGRKPSQRRSFKWKIDQKQTKKRSNERKYPTRRDFRNFKNSKTSIKSA